MVKKILIALLCAWIILPLAGCTKEEEPVINHFDPKSKTCAIILGEDIPLEDVTDFYYTYYNMNYNALYQRYRFYIEDDQYLFFHETRERPDDYGPLTEEDTTAIGTVQLSDEQWNRFLDTVSGGMVKKREESDEDGDDGPWMYVYWNGDLSLYQEYSYASWDARNAFIAYCEELAE